MGCKHGRRVALPPQPAAAPMELLKTAGDVRDALANTMAQVHTRQIDTRTANALVYVATSLLRAIEVSELESRLAALEAIQRAEERGFLQSSSSGSKQEGGR
jgi:hypothetical protein